MVVQLEKLPLNIIDIEKKVFTSTGKNIYIGGVLITQQVRDLLREQAKYFETSQLWEIINSTAISEAAELALKQSQNMEHVFYAKALHHWAYVMKNIINELKK